MEINEKLSYAVDSFLQRGIKWNEENGQIETAIKNALNDFTFRTTKKLNENEVIGVEGLFKELCPNSGDSLLNCFKTYFDKDYNSQEEFDEWHYSTCDIVMTALRKNFADIHYGKAQKIVNMTFKYLYCIVNDKNENNYIYCHMPLDSVILDWIWDNKSIMPYEAINTMPKKLQHGYFDSWSNLEYNGNCNLTGCGNRYSYMFYQHLIRKFCEDKEITPLQLEFLVWPQYQWERAAKEFYKQTENMFSINNEKSKNTLGKLFNSINKLINNELNLIDWKNDLKDIKNNHDTPQTLN